MNVTKKFIVAGVFAASMVGTALADSLRLNLTTVAHPGTVGGVFAVTDFNSPTLGLSDAAYDAQAKYQVRNTGLTQYGFGTFCLEYSEPFSPGSIMDFTVDSFAFRGGLGGQTSASVPGSSILDQDPISLGTALLYSAFASGGLDELAGSNGTSFDYLSQSDVRSLQSAIWYLEGEVNAATTLLYNNLNAARYVNLADTLLGAANHFGDANGAYGVSVLNLTTGSGSTLTQRQSQLFYQGTPVPDAGTSLFLTGFGLLLIGLFRRYSKSGR